MTVSEAARRRIWRISSLARLREMLDAASPAEAEVIRERITERRMHNAAASRKSKARLEAAARAAAETEQDRRVARS